MVMRSEDEMLESWMGTSTRSGAANSADRWNYWPGRKLSSKARVSVLVRAVPYGLLAAGGLCGAVWGERGRERAAERKTRRGHGGDVRGVRTEGQISIS